MGLENDIRITILKELNSWGHTTEQKRANDYLATIETYNGNRDLGTIVEALKDLRHGYLIKETRGQNRIDDIVTNQKGDKNNDWKNPRRFIEPVGIAPQIPNIYLYCTIKGKKFLIENDKLMIDYTLSKWNKRWFVPVAIISTIGLLLSILSILITKEII